MHARSHYKHDNIIIKRVFNLDKEDSGVAKTDRKFHVIGLNLAKCEYLQSASLQGPKKGSENNIIFLYTKNVMLPGCLLLAKSKGSLYSHSIPTPNLVYIYFEFWKCSSCRKIKYYMSIGYVSRCK